MSGHSKWNNIRIRKGIQDRKRSEIFTKASRDILTALRLGKGVDTAIQRAKEVNMPKENITRLINRFNERKGNLIDFTLEGFGPFNIPLMIAVATDNRNRALAEIKTLFKDNGGHLSENGGVAFLFDRLGEIEVAQLSEEKELELIDQGAVDFDDNKVYCQPADLNRLEEILGIKGEIVMRPKTVFNVDGKLAPKILDFIDKLENHDDVVRVFYRLNYVEEV